MRRALCNGSARHCSERVTDERIAPARHVDAEVVVPGDKSISHRALIIGALANGRSYAGNVSPAEDVAATARCLRACGAWVRDFGRGRVALEGSGPGRSLRTPLEPLHCGNSGSTMRLLAGAIAGHESTATLIGDASLQRRPMERVAAPLRTMGAEVRISADGTPPMTVSGRSALRAVDWRSPVASAQVKSAILFAALSGDGRTVVRQPHPTRDHTERLLRMCGIDVGADGDGTVSLNPGNLEPFGMRVPGDISAAAFYLCLVAARPGWRVRTERVGLNPGRTGVLEVLQQMGAAVAVTQRHSDGPEPEGDVEVSGVDLGAMVIDGGLTVRCIDELPVIAVLATQADGETHIRDAAELRTKESDRIAVVANGLRSFGAACETTTDGLVVSGPTTLSAARVSSYGDHRLAMAWAVAAALCDVHSGVSIIERADAAAVSYPSFFDDFQRVVSESD